MCDFRFDEVDPTAQYRVPQIKQHVIFVAFAERELDECGVKNKITTAGNERDLVFVAQQASQTLGGDHASESTT
jgi:hypothetical protein